MSDPVVHLVRTAGTATPALTLDVATTPIVTAGAAAIHLENHDAAPVRGTLTLVASVDLDVDPETRALDLAPGAVLDVPVAVRNRGAFAGSTGVLYAFVTVPDGDRHATIVAKTSVPIAAGASERVMPLAVVLGGAGLLALGLVLRRALAGRGEPTRVDRRRTNPRRMA